MQRNQNPMPSILRLLTCACLALGALAQVRAADKADPSGTGTWTQPGRNNQPDRKFSLKLKTEGDKVTGTISAPGRGGQATETEIADGKLKGEEVSFTVTREFNGNKVVSKYNGKVSEDTIKGKVERPGRNGGDPVTTDWEAKREKK